MTETSRIFVRGLPPNMKEGDFVSHFSKTAPITDAKCIAHRRIGYVGFKTPDAAQDAVKFFNRSFIRTSRISAELAKPAEDLKSKKPSSGTLKYANEAQGRASAPHDAHNPQNKNAVDIPFTGLKGASAGAVKRARSPQSSILPNGGNHQNKHLQESIAPSEQNQDGEDLQKRLGDLIRIAGSSPAPARPDVDTGQEETNLAEPTTNSIEQTAQASDVDWIRSRTNRLLDLVGEDEFTKPHRKEGCRPDTETDLPARPQDQERLLSPTDGNGNGNDRDHQIYQEDTRQEPGGIDSGTSGRQEPGAESPLQSRKPNANPTRLFVRNLSYETTEASLQNLFSRFGTLEEIHIPTDPKTGNSKGLAYILYSSGEAVDLALQELDGKTFEGRLLHLMKSAAKRARPLDMDTVSHLPVKKQKQIKRKADAATATFRWNSLYMNPDAVLASVAERLGVSKSEILDPTSSDAAVKQAHAETNVVQETKAYFVAQGVNLDSFRSKDLSDNIILVKNFAFGTSGEELRNLFDGYGSVKRLLVPPSGTIAIVQMEHPGHARSAFKALAYRRLRDTVLFLEKAPKSIFNGRPRPSDDTQIHPEGQAIAKNDLLEPVTTLGTSSTLFVRNLNFSTTSQGLVELFKPLKGFSSARVKTKTDPKKPGEVLSMGFGFVEFSSKPEAESAAAALSGHTLDGHCLVVRSSHKALDAAEERRKEDLAKKAASRRTKVIIKNLPFEATKKDVRSLFSPYGKLRSVRVPKKLDHSIRGFGFADFVTVKEAENAMDVLQGTHLLGRRLNLEFAAEDAVDPEEQIQRMQEKTEKQTEKVSLQKLTSTARKKFIVNQDEEEMDKF